MYCNDSVVSGTEFGFQGVCSNQSDKSRTRYGYLQFYPRYIGI